MLIKSSLLQLFLSALCGGLVAAVLVVNLTGGGNSTGAPLEPEVVQPGADSPPETGIQREPLKEPSAVRPETSSLLEDLDQRLRELELSSGASGRQSLGDGELTARVETLTARVDALEIALRDGSLVELPKEVLAETLAEVRKDEYVEKIEAYQEERATRLEGDLVKMQDWLELDAYQTDEMRVTLQLQYDRELEQMRLWKETGDNAAVGELKKADGELFADDLSRFLTPEQSESFWTTIGGGKGTGK